MKIYKGILKMLLTAILICNVCVFSGCEETSKTVSKTLRVGVLVYNENDAFITDLMNCMKQDFKELENDSLRIVMTVRDSENSQENQNTLVEEMIDAGCDILCVGLVDRTAPGKIIKMAKNANIPIIFYNRELVYEDLMKWNKMYYVGANAKQSGELQGDIAYDIITKNKDVDRNHDGKIQYVMLMGEMGHQDTIIRTDSSVNRLLDKGVELEKLTYHFADWNKERARVKTQSIIEEYGTDVELIFANNDEMALGAMSVYESVPKEKRPIIIGIDGNKEVLEEIKKGNIQGSVYNDKENQARQITHLALDIYLGNDLSKYKLKDGKYMYLSYSRIDESNVDYYLNKNP